MWAMVTLHVSVWVEIEICILQLLRHFVTLHVSVWVEMHFDIKQAVYMQMSRSTWACELKYGWYIYSCICWESRSTWACELKWKSLALFNKKRLSRSTWACELKYSGAFLLYVSYVSRSTWACELKLLRTQFAPNTAQVTLHVSVWVEIDYITGLTNDKRSRSTWACELKLCSKMLKYA